MKQSPNTIDDRANRLRRLRAALHCLLLLAVAVALRGWQLGHIPGVNGDEAWMGVQAQRFLDASPNSEPVTWHTPTGNPLNWLLFWPTVLLHAWLPPSIGLLRLPALLSGVLALGMNYWLCGRTFGKRLAAISTVLLAVLPINIAYSRFGWDASQSLLVTLPVLYLSLQATNEPERRLLWLLWAAAAQAVALLVHPTNIFAAPLLLVATVSCYGTEIRMFVGRLSESRFKPLAVGGGGLLAVAAVWALWPWCVIATGRITTPGELGTFIALWVDLFSGLTVYQFIPGSLTNPAEPAAIAYRVAAGLLVPLALWGVFQRCREDRSTVLRVLLGGSLTSLAAFFLIAGPEAIRPHYERYGVCLIASGGLVLAIGAEWWLSQRYGAWSKVARLAVPSVAWLLLIGFGVFYLAQFERTGGQSHNAFRTAGVEPKQAALALAINGSHASYGAANSADSDVLVVPDVLIVADDWWNFWPLKYLAHGQSRVTVCRAGDLARFNEQPPHRHNVFWVGFQESEARREWLTRCRAVGYDTEESCCNDYAGRAVLSVIRTRE